MKNPVRSITALSAGVVLLLAAFSCELPPLYEVWGDFKSGELEITPSFITLTGGEQVELTVTGGRAPYHDQNLFGFGTWNFMNGQGLFVTNPGDAGEGKIIITDSKGNQVEAKILVTAVAVPLLRISPTTVSISTLDTVTFTPSGGKTPYTYSSIPEVGTVDPATGMSTVYTPSIATTVVVRVTDASGQVADATVYVSAGAPPLVIDPSSIQITTAETATLTPSGGEVPYTYSVISGTGNVVPLTGLSTVYLPVGVTEAKVRVTDNLGQFATATVTVIAPPAGDPLAIVPRALTIGKFKSFQFSAVDGSPPYQYFIVAGNGSITLDGLYTASNKVGTETVKVRDSNGAEDFATITVKAK